MVESSDGDECIVVVVGGVFLTSIFFLGGVVPLTSDMLSSTVPCSSSLSDCIIVSRCSLFCFSVDVFRFVRIGGGGSGGGLILRVGCTVAGSVACVLVVELTCPVRLVHSFAGDWLNFWMICERYGCGLGGGLRVCALVSVGRRMVVVFVSMCCGIVIAIWGDGVVSVGMFVPMCVVLPVMIACVMVDSWVDIAASSIAMASTSSRIFLLSWVMWLLLVPCGVLVFSALDWRAPILIISVCIAVILVSMELNWVINKDTAVASVWFDCIVDSTDSSHRRCGMYGLFGADV